jgi:hypothetical protein
MESFFSNRLRTDRWQCANSSCLVEPKCSEIHLQAYILSLQGEVVPLSKAKQQAVKMYMGKGKGKVVPVLN